MEHNNDYQSPSHNPEYPSHKQALLVVVVTFLLTHSVGFVATLFIQQSKYIFFAEIFTIIPVLVYMTTQRYSFTQIFRLRPISRDVIICSVLIGIGLTVTSDALDRVIQIVFPIPEIWLESIQEMLTINSISEGIIIVLTAVIMAAVLEEMLFRGFLQTSLENTFDITKAVMLTGLIFGIIHVNPWQTIQLVLFGVFLGVLAWKTNSVFPAMIVHFINNGTAIVFSNLEESQTEWYLMGNQVDPIIFGLALAACIYGFRKLYAIYEEEHEPDSNDSDYTNY